MNGTGSSSLACAEAILTIGVPAEMSEGEDEDGDVDEPTITITITPNKLKRQPSRTISNSGTSNGLFHQLGRATPGVNRNGTSGSRSILLNSTSRQTFREEFATEEVEDQSHQPYESQITTGFDSRSSSRATNLSRKRSMVSFFFGSSSSSSRPVTPAHSLSSVSMSHSSLSLGTGTDASESGEVKVKKGGRFKRVLKKLF